MLTSRSIEQVLRGTSKGAREREQSSALLLHPGPRLEPTNRGPGDSGALRELHLCKAHPSAPGRQGTLFSFYVHAATCITRAAFCHPTLHARDASCMRQPMDPRLGIVPHTMGPKRQQIPTGIFGENLHRARMRVGLSQEELAEKSGISRATIWRLETGKGRGQGPTAPTVEALSGAMGISSSELWSQATVTVPLLEPAIASFVRSPWASVLEPALTERDLEGLRALAGSVWINVHPSDKTLYYLVLANRASAQAAK